MHLLSVPRKGASRFDALPAHSLVSDPKISQCEFLTVYFLKRKRFDFVLAPLRRALCNTSGKDTLLVRALQNESVKTKYFQRMTVPCSASQSIETNANFLALS